MKKVLLMFLTLFILPINAQPTMDGSFDGEVIWGSPISTANGTAGWASANAKKLYFTFDNDYLFFGAEVTASTWMAWAFIINTKSGGGPNDSWARSINYDHTNKPDFVARGHFGSYAEIHAWNGSSWTGVGTGINATEYGENIASDNQDGWVEIRVSRTVITELTGDIQFYITGDNNNHGSFDACPDDNNATSWDHSSNFTSLSNYSSGIPLPVELTFLNSNVLSGSVRLSWQTASEQNNYGFEIERSGVNVGQTNSLSTSVSTWEKIGFVAGHGNSNSTKDYTFTDNGISTSGKYAYRLKQIDNDGTFKYSPVVETDVTVNLTYALGQNYPNPFNPTTKISYTLPETGLVTLRVYNIIGQTVSMLVNQLQDAGRYEVEFNANGLSNGVYFYELKANGFTSVKKLMLVK